jgi:hypothetical protein
MILAILFASVLASGWVFIIVANAGRCNQCGAWTTEECECDHAPPPTPTKNHLP